MKQVAIRRRRTQRGFTFIEVLVVMGIIAALTGLAVVAIQMFAKRGPEIRTTTLVQKLAGTVNQWKLKFGRLPPSDVSKISGMAGGAIQGLRATDDTNSGIEALFQALHWPTFGADPQLNETEIGNTDKDEFSVPAAQGKEAREIIDAWGNPLIYFRNQDYGRADQNPPIYIRRDESEVAPVPWKYEDEGRGFAEPNGFQIFSMGPDEEPNTEDDIKSWE